VGFANSNELIQEALSLERGDLQKHRILVQAETGGELPEVRGNRGQLQQVLINLITNAIDSMAAKEDPRMLCVKTEAYERDGVMISVADSGTGISPQHIDRIFNPLFTTKSNGWGWGCRFAAPSSRPMKAGCGSPRTFRGMSR
jgi:C4-dicarboxylate-specific signal transduction histidine kinase